jgi:hypothetical protein
MSQPSLSSRTVAALDMACLMHRLLAKPSRCTSEERRELRTFYLRALAALNGADLPGGAAIDTATARAAFEAVCKALSLNGVTNAEIVTWFNDSASARLQPVER